eukprot:GHVS01049417.1.p1 GENE.GHVS01049417.1~~GHVS01049417.1.p1  ORF type:complete len:623 (+),score=8.89 GHVS01049417.1:94-1962(+)
MPIHTVVNYFVLEQSLSCGGYNRMENRRKERKTQMQHYSLSFRCRASQRGLFTTLCFNRCLWCLFLVAHLLTALEPGTALSSSCSGAVSLLPPHVSNMDLSSSVKGTAFTGSHSWFPAGSFAEAVQSSNFPNIEKVASSGEGMLQGFYAQFNSVMALIWSPFLWSVQRPSAENFAIFSPAIPNMESLDEDARIVGPILNRLKQRTFFKIFNVDLDKPCPFWAAEAMCREEGSCSVCQCDDDQIPVVWKMKPIEDFVNRKHAASFTPWEGATTRGGLGNDGSFGAVSNELRGPKASYVDLSLNPPSYTAFKGGAAWDQIYRENCMRLANPLGGVTETGECREEEMFFRIISGLHSNIAALSSEYYYDIKTNGSLVTKTRDRNEGARYNMEFFREKLGLFPERISNLYFTFSILLRTVCELGPVLQECSCEAGNASEDLAARADLFQLLNQTLASCDAKYTEAPLFNRRSSSVINQFHNITRILDCVECEKCRLHGKLKMTALQVALRASAPDTYVQSLERNEITALINALAYFTDAVQIIGRFESRLFWIRVLLVLRVLVVFLLIAVVAKCITRLRFRRSSSRSNEAGKKLCDEGGAEHTHASTPTSAGSTRGSPLLTCTDRR